MSQLDRLAKISPVCMSAQEWFMQAWERAKDPRKASLDNDDDQYCAYWSPDGDIPGCFIGCSIDEDHARLFKGKAAAWLLRDADALRVVDLEDWKAGSFLSDLQEIHDLVPPEAWPRHLAEFGRNSGHVTLPDEAVHLLKQMENRQERGLRCPWAR